MSGSLRVVLILITIIYLFLLIRTIRKKNLQVSFSAFWMVSGIGLILALAIPYLIEIIAKALGFDLPSNMVFCLTIFIAFYMIFKITIKLSQENKRNTALIQEVSMLKKRVEELEQKIIEKE